MLLVSTQAGSELIRPLVKVRSQGIRGSKVVIQSRSAGGYLLHP